MQIGGVLLPYIAFGLSAVVLVLMRWHLHGLQPFSRAPGAAHRRHHRIGSTVEPGRAHGPTVGPG